jgi:hypothetical protein
MSRVSLTLAVALSETDLFQELRATQYAPFDDQAWAAGLC